MDSVSDIAREAFVYGLPTVDLYRILHDFALDPASPEFKAPLNEVFHSRRLADPRDRSIVAMNVDTPYSYAWLDLRSEPVVLTMPAFEPQRYVSAQLIDLYTYIVGYISPRTNGHRGGEFLIAGPSWTGEASPGMWVFRCPTELCLVLIRTQLFDEEDMPNVVAIQDAVSIRPLSASQGQASPRAAPALAPIERVDVRAAADLRFFDVLAWMLALMPTLPEDRDLRDRMARIGVRPGTRLDLPASSRQLVLAGMRAGMQEILERSKRVRSSREIFGSREFFAGDHLARATGAFLGILGNAAEEYLGVGYQADAQGRPFDGARRYTITFAPGGLPPVSAFWSITVYDADKHLYANEIDRYVISSRHITQMTPDPNGGLTIDIQHEAPAPGRIANWLPCPPAPFGLTFRTYLPSEAIRTGAWTPPPVQPHDQEGP
jgi:hypothetical protein